MPRDPHDAACRLLESKARALRAAFALVADDAPCYEEATAALREAAAILEDGAQVCRDMPVRAQAVADMERI